MGGGPVTVGRGRPCLGRGQPRPAPGCGISHCPPEGPVAFLLSRRSGLCRARAQPRGASRDSADAPSRRVAWSWQTPPRWHGGTTMVARRLCLGLLLLWLTTAAIAAWVLVNGWTAPGRDGRTEVRLAPAERALVLGEMRQLLKALHGVVTGLG